MKTVWVLDYSRWDETHLVGIFESKDMAKQALIDQGINLSWSVYFAENEEAKDTQRRLWTLYELKVNVFHTEGL